MPSATFTPVLPRKTDHQSPDTDLIALSLAGSTEAFATLFHRYYTAIHAFAYRLCLCGGEAEDIAQETFIQAARSLYSFRREASFKNWLYTIAANRARDSIRQQRRRARLDDSMVTDFTDRASEGTHTSAENQQVIIHQALTALPEDQRTTIILVYYENLSHAEAARVLGCAESTVSWRLFRAKAKLRTTLRLHHHD